MSNELIGLISDEQQELVGVIAGETDINVTIIDGGSRLHNNLVNLQGGTEGEYYHLTEADSIKNTLSDNVQTLSNKTIILRELEDDSTSNYSPPIDDFDIISLFSLDKDVHFDIPIGTPFINQKILIKIRDNGVSRNLSWDNIYRPIGFDLPIKTVTNKLLYLGCVYCFTDSKWDVVAMGQE